MRFIIIIYIISFSISLFSQKYIGNFRSKISTIALKPDYTFIYNFKADLLRDEAIGNYTVKNDTIILNYTTPNYRMVFLVDTIEYPLDTNPPKSWHYIDTNYLKFPDPSSYYRPSLLLIRRHKLIAIVKDIKRNKLPFKRNE